MSADDPRSWLKRSVKSSTHSCGKELSQAAVPTLDSTQTRTSVKMKLVQNNLQAIPFPLAKTGYRDPQDPCNRTNKRNGGDFKRFESAYQAQFAPLDETKVRFREDGIPISAKRIPGKPLMAPKLPDQAIMGQCKALREKYNYKSQITFGNPSKKDPKMYKTVSSLVHSTPKQGMTSHANPGIAAQQAVIAHQKLGML